MVAYHHPAIFFNEIRKIISRPIILYIRKMLRRITRNGLSPIFMSDFITSSQYKLANKPKGNSNRPILNMNAFDSCIFRWYTFPHLLFMCVLKMNVYKWNYLDLIVPYLLWALQKYFPLSVIWFGLLMISCPPDIVTRESFKGSM